MYSKRCNLKCMMASIASNDKELSIKNNVFFNFRIRAQPWIFHFPPYYMEIGSSMIPCIQVESPVLFICLPLNCYLVRFLPLNLLLNLLNFHLFSKFCIGWCDLWPHSILDCTLQCCWIDLAICWPIKKKRKKNI